jgi:hypothetical protein
MKEENRFSKVKQLSKAKRAQLDEKTAAQKATRTAAEENQAALRAKDPRPAERLPSDDDGFGGPPVPRESGDRVATSVPFRR